MASASCIGKHIPIALVALLLLATSAMAQYSFPAPNSNPFVLDFSVAISGNQSRLLVAEASGDASLQAVVELAPCTALSLHNHPRATEFAFVTSGELQFALVLENGTTVVQTVKAGQVFYQPQGLMHYQYNPTCTPASFYAVLDSANPGTSFIIPGVLGLPAPFLTAATRSASGCALPTFTGTFPMNAQCLATCQGGRGRRSHKM